MKKVLSGVLVMVMLLAMGFPTSLFAKEIGSSQNSGIQKDSQVDENVLTQTTSQPENTMSGVLSAEQTAGISQSIAVGTDVPEITATEANIDTQGGSDAIDFSDSNLYNALIESYVDTNKDGVISKMELASMRKLDLKNKDIKDISPLSNATSLQGLFLDNNVELSNIDVLKTLSSLKLVTLGGTAVSDLDRLSLIKVEDQTGMAGYGKILTIPLHGEDIDQAFVSLNPEIAEVSVIHNYVTFDWIGMLYNGSSLKVLFKKEGVTTIQVSLGDATASFKVTVSPIPSNAIQFEEPKIGTALIDDGWDRNGDGFITADELALVNSLDLSGLDLKSLKGLESATGLERMFLSDNKDLKDFSPLKELVNINLLRVNDTGISPADRLSFLNTEDRSVLQGMDVNWLEPDGLLSDSSLFNFVDYKLSFSNPEIAEVISTDRPEYITGKKPGTTRVTVEYEGATASFNLTVNTVNPDQPMGEKVSDLSFFAGADQISLDGTGNLWDISEGEPKLAKAGVKSYDNLVGTIPYSINGANYIRRWGTILDNQNMLWLWDLANRDQEPVEQVKNVKELTTDYVNSISYIVNDSFGLAMDEDNNLWMIKNNGQTSAYSKVVDNVKTHNWIFALDNNHTLWQFYENTKEVLKDVEDFDFVRQYGNTDAVVYVLKTDHSLWYGHSESGGFIKIAHDVASLVKGNGNRGFVKIDGSSWKYQSDGSSEITQVSELYKKKLDDFWVKNDGSTWYKDWREPIKVMNTEVDQYFYNNNNYSSMYGIYYLVDTSHNLWKFDPSSGEEAVKISGEFKAFTGWMLANNNGSCRVISSSCTGYMNTVGEWLDFDGNPQAATAEVYQMSNYHIKGDHVVYCSNISGGSEMPLLNQIESFVSPTSIEFLANDKPGVYVKRTDGSIWLISGSNPPVMVNTGSSTAEPVEGGFVAFLGKDSQKNYYEYNATDLNNSYLAYQINSELPSAKMYLQFLDSHCQVIGLKDQAKGYMDYNAAATASLLAQMRGEAFDINVYFGNSDAKKFAETVGLVKTVDKDGNVT